MGTIACPQSKQHYCLQRVAASWDKRGGVHGVRVLRVAEECIKVLLQVWDANLDMHCSYGTRDVMSLDSLSKAVGHTVERDTDSGT